ncbi:MAG: ANTAR domain-containing protein [Thermoleophilaceae bacterium]
MNALRVLIADEDSQHLESLAEVVRHLGHEVSAHAVSLSEAAERIAAEDPAVALVALHQDAEHALALIEQIAEYASGPVIAVIDREDPEFVRRAADGGIYAYAQPLNPTTVQNAIEVAVRRRGEAEQLEERVDQLESALERRAVIERAKGILMERHRLDDRSAFDLLREHARSRRIAVADLARSVTEGQALLPRR